MNLFCFSLEGSMDSMYEAAQGSPRGEEFSPPARRRTCSLGDQPGSGERVGSETSITLEAPQAPIKTDLKAAKRNRLHTSVSTNEEDSTASSHVYWSCSKRKNKLVHIKIQPNEDVGEDLCITKPLCLQEGLKSVVKREKDRSHQGKNFEDWNPNKKSSGIKQQDLGGEDEAWGMLRTLVWIKKSSVSVPEEVRHITGTVTVEKDITEPEGPWSAGPVPSRWDPGDGFPAWEAPCHTCHRPTGGLAPTHWIHTLDGLHSHGHSLPRDADRYQDLILDKLRQERSPQGTVCSLSHLEITDLSRSTSFGKFDASQSQTPETHGDSPGTEGKPPEGDQHKGVIGKRMKAISMTMRKKMGRKYVKALSEEMGEQAARDHEWEGEAGSSGALANGEPKSNNSIESLHGEQSSTGVVTAGFVGSDSAQRQDEGRRYTGNFCGRAKVHTNFVPSPYDTESLKLKAGDVIDIISKPPMGIWTGMLNGKVGNFKFIYVDILAEETAPIHRSHDNRGSQRPRPKTLHELLQSLNLEELESSLLLNGYQTVEDLKDLKEQHLIELNVTDPELRFSLLAATQSLQDAECNSQKEDDDTHGSAGEAVKAEENECPRDSGCYVASDCSDNSREDTETHLAACVDPPPAEA